MSHNKNFQSPFLDVTSFPKQDPETVGNITNTISIESSSPFTSMYEMEGGEVVLDPESEEFIQFLGELHDEEFDESVFEIVNEASAFYEKKFNQDISSQPMEAERFLAEYFAPLQSKWQDFQYQVQSIPQKSLSD